jgi:DNA polymerase III alpha subunit
MASGCLRKAGRSKARSQIEYELSLIADLRYEFYFLTV